jgi:succinyl-diaminopimelate desuccinylase
MAHHPEWISGDFAVLGEPTGGAVEAGCNGVLRVAITFHGKAAHAARAWMGVNAIHAAAPLLRRLATWTPRRAQVDGLEYTESLGAVRIMGGTASNVIPDRCEVEVNYRFAPDRDEASALAWLLGFLDLNADAADGPVPSVRVLDSAAAARPGLRWPAAQEFLAAAASEGLTEVKPKLGWTDVARFSAAGIPAVNCGPGDASLAHRDDEHCPLGQLHQVEAALRAWLT